MNAPAIDIQQQTSHPAAPTPPVYSTTGQAYVTSRPSEISPLPDIIETPAKTAGAKKPAKRSWKRRVIGKLASPPAIFVLATIIAPGLFLGARHGLVEQVPAMAQVYGAIGLPVNLDGLELRDVTSTLKTDAQGRHLLVKGQIINVRDRTGKLPNLRLALRGKDGRDLYNWQAPTPQKRIKARDTIRFVARLDSPPEGVKDVFVRFARKGG